MSASPTYDEFGMLGENASEVGLEVPLPQGSRVESVRPDGSRVSAIRWGHDPKVVFLHGGGQNAHTWDTVVVGLGVPALAVDLPGHGHSEWRADKDYWPVSNAEAVAQQIREHAPNAVAVVGMSLGGLTTMRLAGVHPDLVRMAVVIDVTPLVMQRQVNMSAQQKGTTALTQGPATYDDFEAMVAATAAAAPHRTPGNIRRGVLHNARQFDDGRWGWRYDRLGTPEGPAADFMPLWNDLAISRAPIALVVGGDSAFVGPEDRAEFRRRRRDAVVEEIPGAGHSVQSDQPLRLVAFLRDFLADELT